MMSWSSKQVGLQSLFEIICEFIIITINQATDFLAYLLPKNQSGKKDLGELSISSDKIANLVSEKSFNFLPNRYL